MNPGLRIAPALERAAHAGTRAYVHRDARINELHVGTSENQRLAPAHRNTRLR